MERCPNCDGAYYDSEKNICTWCGYERHQVECGNIACLEYSECGLKGAECVHYLSEAKITTTSQSPISPKLPACPILILKMSL